MTLANDLFEDILKKDPNAAMDALSGMMKMHSIYNHVQKHKSSIISIQLSYEQLVFLVGSCIYTLGLLSNDKKAMDYGPQIAMTSSDGSKVSVMLASLLKDFPGINLESMSMMLVDRLENVTKFCNECSEGKYKDMSKEEFMNTFGSYMEGKLHDD